MRKVIGIGETVLDIIFKDGKPIEAVPGGSAFNALISLGRSGIDSTFISEAGNDRVGEYIIDFLRKNGVNADNVNVFPIPTLPFRWPSSTTGTMPNISFIKTTSTTDLNL